MYFSSKELTKLLIDSIENDRLDQDALRGLIYYLNFPNEEIPIFIAETLLNEPDMITNQEILGKRLAYSHVGQLSDLRHPELRATRQIRICRQLNRIALYLEEKKAPASIISDFSKLCQSFISTLIFFEARKQDERFAFAAEEVLIIEQLIHSILASKELSLKFYETLFAKLGLSRAQILATSLLTRLDESMKAVGENAKDPIIDPNSSPALSKELETLNGFTEAVSQLTSFLESKKGNKNSLH